MKKLITTQDFIKRVAANMNPGRLEGGQDQSPLSFDEYQEQVSLYAEKPLSGQDGYISDYSPTDAASAFNGYPTTYSGTDVFQEEANRHYEVGGQNGYKHKTEDGSPPILDWLFSPVDGDTVSNPMRSDYDTGTHGTWRNKNASTFYEVLKSTASPRQGDVQFMSSEVEPRIASTEDDHMTGRFTFQARSVTGQGNNTVDLQFMNKRGEGSRPVSSKNLKSFDVQMNCSCNFYKFYGPLYYANNGNYQIMELNPKTHKKPNGEPYEMKVDAFPKARGKGQKLCKHILAVFRDLGPALAVSEGKDVALEKSIWKVNDPEIFKSGERVEFWRDKMELDNFSEFHSMIVSKVTPWALRIQLDRSLRTKGLNFQRWYFRLGQYMESEQTKKGLQPHDAVIHYINRCAGVPLAALFFTRYVYHLTDYTFKNKLIKECFEILNGFLPVDLVEAPAEEPAMAT